MYTYTVCDVPKRSWAWGWRCEIRIHAKGIDPHGRGYRDRCHCVWGDYDRRYTGPRSEFGKACLDAQHLVDMLNTSTNLPGCHPQ